MKHLNLFIQLTRLNKPIGFMLLFWPCAWGLTIGYDFSKSINTYIYYLFLFFLGSIFMRSAGCIINDIADKELDKKIERTKNRPIASNKISIKLGLIYSFFLCFLAFLVLIKWFHFKIFSKDFCNDHFGYQLRNFLALRLLNLKKFVSGLKILLFTFSTFILTFRCFEKNFAI